MSDTPPIGTPDALRSSRFRREREADWQRLETLLSRIERGGARRLSADEMIDLPRAYRATLSALSVARETSLDRGLTDYLEALSTRAYFAVYGNRTRLTAQLGTFFARGWPAAVQAIWRETLAAALFTALGALAAYLLVSSDPDWYQSFVGEMAQGRTPAASTESLREGLYTETGTDGLSTFAATLLSHNARIALLAFALGFAFCVPTVVLLLSNGAILGAFFALYASRGLGIELGGWLLIHGVTELLAVILAGAAGLRIGWSIAFPGRRSRLRSASEAGKTAGTAMGGILVMLAFAAVLEGFGRSLITNDTARYAVASATALVWSAYLYAPRGAAGPR